MTSPSSPLQAFSRELGYCTYCPRLCRFACPVAEAERRETVHPTAKMTLLYHVGRGDLELERETAAPWFHCTGCGLHTMACEHRIEVDPVLRVGRELAAERGVVPEPLRLHVERLEGAEAELQSRAGALLSRAPRGGEAAFIPGAHALLHEPALVSHTWELLSRLAGRELAVWPGPHDLGSGLLAAGERRLLAQRAGRVATAAAGFRRLWVLEPEDAWLLRAIYPELGVELAPEVRLPLEALDRHLPQAWRGRSRATEAEGTTVYHDPCYLGRRLGIYEAPRRVLRLLLDADPAEPPWTREWGWCCGGGQHYPEVEPAGAAAMAATRAEQLLQSGAQRVVSACPRCLTQLRQALAGAPVTVVDLLQLVDPHWELG